MVVRVSTNTTNMRAARTTKGMALSLLKILIPFLVGCQYIILNRRNTNGEIHPLAVSYSSGEAEPRQTPMRRPSPPDQDDRNNTAYTCTYGADPRNNRTTVVVPYGAPTFVVIGVQKAGTTVLLALFKDHPDILPAKRDELHFFDWWKPIVEAKMRGLNTTDMNDADTSCLMLDRYMGLFQRNKLLKSPKKLYTMEKTPIYITDEKNPHRMKMIVPWTKLVVILRNPVDRLYSHFKMTIRDVPSARNKTLEPMMRKDIQFMRDNRMTTAPLPEPVHDAPVDNAGAGNHSLRYEILPSVPFDHAILDRTRWDFGNIAYKKQRKMFQSMVGRGLYAYQLEHWLRNYTIGTDLLVVNYDDLKRDTKSVYERILDFVGIPFPTVGINFDKKARKDNRRTHRPFANETRRYMTEFYAPYNAQLESLLGPAWSPANLGWG
jgi:hypothetical protein